MSGNKLLSLFDVLFGASKPQEAQPKTLDDIGLDDLRGEKVKLEYKERELVEKVERLEAQKRALFVEGKQESSARKMRIIARKIKEVDGQAKDVDKQLAVIAQQMRVINGFVQIKESQRMLSEMGLSSLVADMDLYDLREYVEQASIDGELRMERLAQLVHTVEGDSPEVAFEEDQEILDIMAAMQEAKEAEAEHPEAVEQEMQRLDQILSTDDDQEPTLA